MNKYLTIWLRSGSRAAVEGSSDNFQTPCSTCSTLTADVARTPVRLFDAFQLFFIFDFSTAPVNRHQRMRTNSTHVFREWRKSRKMKLFSKLRLLLQTWQDQSQYSTVFFLIHIFELFKSVISFSTKSWRRSHNRPVLREHASLREKSGRTL